MSIYFKSNIITYVRFINSFTYIKKIEIIDFNKNVIITSVKIIYIGSSKGEN